MLGQDSAGGGIDGIALFLIAVPLYFLPFIVAAVRKVPNIGSVFVLNAFLGWTFVGWIIALAMAARTVPPQYRPSATTAPAPPAPPMPPKMPPTA